EEADGCAVGDAEPCGVFRREIDRLAEAQRRRIAAGLHTGVERVEPPSGRQTDRKIVGQRIDGWLEFGRHEWRRWPLDWPLPEAIVQKWAAGMVLARTGPLQPAVLLQSLIRHAAMPVRQPADFVPNPLRRWSAPVVAHPAREIAEDGDVVARAVRRFQRLSYALHTTLAAGHGAFRLAPGRGSRQHDVGELGSSGQEHVLDDDVIEVAEQAQRSRRIGF